MKHKKMAALLVGLISVVALFIYGYSRYGLEFGKFFAAEPSVLTSQIIRCSASQPTVLSGKPVTFTASLIATPAPTLIRPTITQTPKKSVGATNVMTPTPKVVPTRTVQPTFIWTATSGVPTRGEGTQFTVAFTNAGTSAATRLVILSYGKEQTTCSVSVLPLPIPVSIQLEKPNGGQTFRTGEIMPITWKTTGVDASTRVGLQISYLKTDGTRLEDGISTTNPLASDGRFNWTIPAKYGTSTYVQNQFKMRVFLVTNSGVGGAIGDYSDAPFTIIPSALPTPGSSINVTSPQAGYTIVYGSMASIIWNGASGATVDIILTKDQTPTGGYYIARGVPNTGSYSWDTTKPMAPTWLSQNPVPYLDLRSAPGSFYKVRVQTQSSQSGETGFFTVSTSIPIPSTTPTPMR